MTIRPCFPLFMVLALAASCRNRKDEGPSAPSAQPTEQASSSAASGVSAVASTLRPSHTGTVKSHGTAQPVVAFSDSAPAPGPEPSASPTSVGLPTVDFGPPGPLVIRNYPRLSYDRIASLVYNDTGFRHHKAKEYTASRDLFLKATWANPKAPLPPYNLACAYALLGDATHAEKALRLAIAVAGEKVKGRAKKDSDFKSVLSAKWFRDLTD